MKTLSLSLSLASVLAFGCSAPPSSPETIGEADQAEHGHDHDASFGVDFAGCREVANVGLLPTANARPLVPPQFTLVGDGTEATPFVVRTVHCDSVSVDGKHPKEGLVAQVGFLIVPPEGDGDINNYTLFYETTDAELAHKLQQAGVNARHAPGLREHYTQHADGSADYHFSSPIDPNFSLDGTVGAPVGGPIPFVANWWRFSFGNTVKMNSTFPQLFTAGNVLTLTTFPHSQLANILGTTSVSSWPVLELFDDFPSAHMDVIVEE